MPKEGLVEFKDEDLVSFNDHILKIEKFNQLSAFSESSSVSLSGYGHIRNGIDCEVLRLGESAWRKGKMKFRLVIDFIPDAVETQNSSESDSSLDQIRQMLNKPE